MKKPFLIVFALAAAPFAAQAETINIYGWQNHSWEFIDIDGGRSFDRTQSNAGNIGFAASMDTGMDGVTVNFQCEQFTFYNHFGGFGDWCNRNSKIGLAHPQAGEIMMATWLLPYNEGVAQWVDPFYDAGADSHTSIMGSVGAAGTFYNTGFGYAGSNHLSFNRRQENIIQYWSPNWNGFVFRFAWTVGNNDETDNTKGHSGGTEIDPVIRSSSLAYTNGPLWLAVTWQDHEDWTAHQVGEMDTSDAESFRLAGRYIMDMGDGVSVQISAMWEDLEYEFNGVTSVSKAMGAFGYSNFDSYNLMYEGEDNANVKAQKTLGLIRDLFPKCFNEDTGVASSANANCPTGFGDMAQADTNSVAYYTFRMPTMDNPATLLDEGDSEKNTDYDKGNADTMLTTLDDDSGTAGVQNILTRLQAAYDTDATADGVQYVAADASTVQKDAKHAYDSIVAEADKRARAAHGAGGNVKVERDAWMVSGKVKFGGPVDFRFSYMDADDLEVSCGGCSGDWDETAADAWNVGVFYTMPAGTELRLTYSEVDNDENASYDFGIGTLGMKAGQSVEMFAVGIVHWFD